LPLFADNNESKPTLPAKYKSQISSASESDIGSVLVKHPRNNEDVLAKSTKVLDSGILSGQLGITPQIEFAKGYEYYATVPEYQNVVESIIAEILSRDWYFSKAEKGGSEQGVRDMEAFEEKYNLSRIFEYLVRDWLIVGNSIISVADWQPVQMSSIYSMVRDRFGNTVEFVQRVNGAPDTRIPLKQVIHTRFIELDRQAWGVPYAFALMNTFTDVDGYTSKAPFDWWRQMMQDSGAIIHRLGWPRELVWFPGMPQSTVDQKIGPDMKAQKPGDILAIGGASMPAKPEVISDVIDAKSRFEGHHALMKNSLEAGLQSSALRLITEPSAMADAREANAKDDSRILAIMEKIRRFVQELVIPRITSSKVEFHWGKQDQLNIDATQLAELLKVPKIAASLTTEETRKLLMAAGIGLESENMPAELVQGDDANNNNNPARKKKQQQEQKDELLKKKLEAYSIIAKKAELL
jgi:hypothetical protein